MLEAGYRAVEQRQDDNSRETDKGWKAERKTRNQSNHDIEFSESIAVNGKTVARTRRTKSHLQTIINSDRGDKNLQKLWKRRI